MRDVVDFLEVVVVSCGVVRFLLDSSGFLLSWLLASLLAEFGHAGHFEVALFLACIALDWFFLELLGDSGCLAAWLVLPLVLVPLVGLLVVSADLVGSLCGFPDVHSIVVLCDGCHLLPIQVFLLLGVFPDLLNGAVHEHYLRDEVGVPHLL